MRLSRSDPAQPGLRRLRWGGGWRYRRADGDWESDPEVLERIRQLTIPPDWREVWICPAANGHIQAMGLDRAGRRQYRYHDRWTARREQLKYARVADFGAALPPARRRVSMLLAQPGLGRDKMLAAAFRLLDLGHFRIGGEQYRRTNGSVGLATLERRHLRRQSIGLMFSYRAKSGQHQRELIQDADLARVMMQVRRRRGGPAQLLAYRSENEWRQLRSAEINGFVKETVGDDFSAKDFRTWHGTVLATVALSWQQSEMTGGPSARRHAMAQAVALVADALGNTPAVCRRSYIAPKILDAFEDRALPAVGRRPAADRLVEGLRLVGGRPRTERLVLRLLRD